MGRCGGCGMGGCGYGGFFFFWCGCSGSGWWLVAVMVGGCGGCDMGGWMWWLAVLG